jgi:excisionase family DNA binding protein
MNRKLLSTKDAVERLGLSADHVRRLLEQGKIERKKVRHDWIIFNLDYKRRKPKKSK